VPSLFEEPYPLQPSRLVRLVPLVALAVAACAHANPDGLPGFVGLERQIGYYYADHAWEGGANCLAPRMLGITRARVAGETATEYVLDVRYLWQDRSFGGTRRSSGEGGSGGSSGRCFGDGERQFVVAKRQGGGYSVVSMSGPQRGGG
jgi:hypothetical protein